MAEKFIPGTVVPEGETMRAGMFAMLRPMIAATNGLTLAQVCAITGLESSTIQNWVKRDFVAHPENKKYYERHLARILIISMLRDSLKIDDVGELMRMINGDATDESDDLIPEPELYDCLCEVIAACEDIAVSTPGQSEDELRALITAAIGHYHTRGDEAKERLTVAMLVMVSAYRSSVLKRSAEEYMNRLRGM